MKFYNIPENAKYFIKKVEDIGLGEYFIIEFYDKNKKKILG